jgi:hypothetical protein
MERYMLTDSDMYACVPAMPMNEWKIFVVEINVYFHTTRLQITRTMRRTRASLKAVSLLKNPRKLFMLPFLRERNTMYAIQ